MSISQEPGKTPQRAGHHQWDYLSVPNGKSDHGYLAGSTIGVYVHDGQPSRPCRTLMTNGLILCPYCEAGDEPRWKGYVPLFDRDYSRRFVLISEGCKASVGEIEVYDQVEITRALNSKAPAVVRAKVWTPKACNLSEGRSKPADLECALFTIWKDKILHEWYHGQTRTRPAPVKTEKPLPLPLPKTVDAVPESVAKRIRGTPVAVAPAVPPTVEESLKVTMDSIKKKFGMTPSFEKTVEARARRAKPSKNGHAKQDPPKG